MKTPLTCRCWNNSHLNINNLSEKLHNKSISKIEAGQLVCQACGSQLCPLYSTAILFPSKPYTCESGHLNVLFAFKDGKVNIKWGNASEDSINIFEVDSDIKELIEKGKISCYHLVNGVKCSHALSSLDETPLEAPTVQQAKTKTRVGDLWDRHGLESVKPSHYTNDGQFIESKTDVANKARLEKMSRDRSISNHPGTKIKRRNIKGI
jgi:hypothetical protein